MIEGDGIYNKLAEILENSRIKISRLESEVKDLKIHINILTNYIKNQENNINTDFCVKLNSLIDRYSVSLAPDVKEVPSLSHKEIDKTLFNEIEQVESKDFIAHIDNQDSLKITKALMLETFSELPTPVINTSGLALDFDDINELYNKQIGSVIKSSVDLKIAETIKNN